MELPVRGHRTYCYTGGKPFDAAKPTVVMIHGVLHDHSVWGLQSRYLAHHGWNVLAVDLPGHCRSEGEPPSSVEEGAEFVGALLDAARLERAALIGHSWGSLIALEAAARMGARASHAVLVGTAFPMKVSQPLLEASLHEPEKAIRMVDAWSRSTLAPPPSALGPGTWVSGMGVALNRRVLRSNPRVNLYHRGFLACDRYANGLQAVSQVACPLLFVLGEQDQMTPPRAAQGLVEAARAAGKRCEVRSVPAGHHEMNDAPEATLFAIREFLGQP